MSWLPIDSSPKVKRLRPETKRRIIMATAESLARNVPVDVLKVKLFHETGYSISGINNIIAEARLLLGKIEPPQNERLEF